MIRAANNNVIVKVKHKFTGGITSIAKIAAIQNLSSIELGDYVTIVGDVVSTPLEISKKREYTGFGTSDIKEGDVAIFSHLVINEYVQESSDQLPRFKNSFWYNGNEYFVCDILRLFAVIRDGEIRMQNGYVMLSEVEKPSAIFVPGYTKKIKKAISATISGTAEQVYINPIALQSYKINDKPFFIIPQQHILGRGVTGCLE